MNTLPTHARAHLHVTVLQLLLVLAALFFQPATVAATGANNDWLKPASDALAVARHSLESFNPDAGNTDDLDPWVRVLGEIRLNAQKCIDARVEEINSIKETVKAAGEVVTGTATPGPDAATQKRLDELDAQLTACSTLLQDARTLGEEIRTAQQSVLKYRLLGRGPDIWDVTLANLQQAGSLPATLQAFFLDRLQLIHLRRNGWAALVTLVITAVMPGIWWRRQWRRRLAARTAEGISAGLNIALQACLARNLPVILGLSTATGLLLLLLPTRPVPPAVAVLLSILVYLVANTFLQALLNPCRPAVHFLSLEPAYSRAVCRRAQGLLFIVLALILVLSTGTHSVLTPEQWYLLRAVFLTVATVQLVWLVSTLHGAPSPLFSPKLRGLIVLLLLTGVVIELLGFRILSWYLFRGLLGTALLAAGLWLLNSLLQDAFDGMDTGRYAWERRLRARLSLKEGEAVPGLIWLRLLTVLLIWLAFGIMVVGLWGYSDTFWSLVRQGITEGFRFGPVRIIPIHWVTGIIVFSILVTLVSWTRNEVLPGWVKKSRIERGAQEAIVTLSGYVGMIIAALIGLSLAGFSFTNLAIIAGALSVGIGFGLQNIVNNFISGIILLFERPIRTGDWVVVGNTEGYVRRISIRSTQIETFDRADVIVPNSELISNQVTNWMLRDPWGRVIVPIGVAYGSDVERVRDLLLRVAMEHPLVITDGNRVSPPRVLFRSFGDSSLNFELRCFIRNVDQRLGTLSELNFAIEKALREANIQIPFPQRDLHVRSMDPGIGFGQPPE
ncbi:MAG TPA: mechanosensitive ion channel domain-containing protein [Gammaproteobacteria bacterium]|nr:mechanosensitive ion channel domain-containing protein [Gammaproteobacteria bacterium]